LTATFTGASKAPDVVVIGGGIMGCSAAYFLARAGVSVTLLERAEQVGTQASGRNAGGIRANGRKPAEVPLAIASIQLWELFRDEMGGHFEYDQDGQMYLARNETEMALLRRAATVLTGLGLGVRVVTGPDLKELVPNLSSLIIGGLYCPTDGQANPILATRFVGRMAAQAGATIQTDTAVTGLECQGDRITGVITNRGRISTGAVVVTAGPWANQVAAMVGVTIPLLIKPTWSAVTTPTARLLRPMVSGNTVYIRPTRSGNLLLGGSLTSPVPAAAFDTRSNLSVIRWSMSRAIEVLPALRQTSLLRTWGGTLVHSPDHMLILDAMPGIENMTFATGCSGHGFCLGPIVGKLLSEMTLGVTTSLSVDAVRLSRFERQA
jgi:sarcosine oxidase subunit beta